MSDCEIPTVYNTSEPKARKVYACCECSAPINIGEKHFHGTGIWEGKFASYRQHLACCEACMVIRQFNDNECIGFGGMKSYASEYRFGIEDAVERGDANAKRLAELLEAIERRESAELSRK